MATGERSFADLKGAIDYRLSAKRPLVELEITSRCNTLCRCCERSGPLAHEVPTRETMSIEQVERVLHQFQSTNPSGFSFSAGESLLHPQFFEIVDMIHVRFPQAEISLFTNGIVLVRDSATLERLIASPVDSVTFSLHGAREETVSLLQPGVKLGATLEIAQQLVAESEKGLCLNYVVQQENLLEMCEFLDLAAAAGVPMVSYAAMNYIGHTHEVVDYDALWSEWKLQERLDCAYRKADELGIAIVKGFEVCTCDLPADIVSATGELWACIAKQREVGNLFAQPLPNLKRKQRTERRRLLRALEAGNIPAECAACAVRSHGALR